MGVGLDPSHFALIPFSYTVDVAQSGQILPGIPVLREFLAGLYLSASAMLIFDPPLLPDYPPVGVSPWLATVALIQGAIAYFLLALFLVTFVQKASRQ